VSETAAVPVSPNPYSTSELAKMFESDVRLKATFAALGAEFKKQVKVRDTLLAGMTIQAGGKYTIDAKNMDLARGPHKCDVSGSEDGSIHFAIAIEVDGKTGEPKTIEVEAKDVTNAVDSKDSPPETGTAATPSN
jgi:hypothetical protein